MKFVAISDTHGQHASLSLPEADAIIHAGDISKRGTEQQIKEFLEWFASLNYRYKVPIAGNHDFFLEKISDKQLDDLIPKNVIYLNDSGIEIEGIRIWGSPVQPWFHDWAFNRYRGADIKRHWDLIPKDTDILVTHGPVKGILDRTVYGQEVGCTDLLDAVQNINPSYHICGHIHEAYGQVVLGNTNFINASVLNEDYCLVNPPIEFELKK